MTPSAVSQHIRQLERGAGVRLLHRSTRQLSPTPAGQRFYLQCAAVAEAAQRARAELASEQAPSGELRLSAPVGFARHAGPALGPWLARFPQLRLRLLLDDAAIDLVQSRVDLALRFGPQADSAWVARPLASTPNWLCAAPAWLRANRRPDHPAELAGAGWLSLSQAERSELIFHWQSADGAQAYELQAQPRWISNHQGAVQQLCEAGLGLAVLSALDVTEALAQGRLCRLLPDWEMGRLDIWALTPQRDALPAKVIQALDELRAYFGRLDGAQVIA